MKRLLLISGIVLIGVILACGCTTQPSGPPATTPPATSPPGTTLATTPPTVITTPATTQPTSPQGGTASVEIRNFAFVPGTLTVSRGTTVTWTNQDSAAHQIVSDTSSPVSFMSNPLSKGSAYSFLFNDAGTFTYHCGIHPSMKGTITVT